MYFDAATTSQMSLEDLRRLAQTGEGTFLEFKRTVPSAEKIARELAAFANTKGGTLLVGVDDDKSLVGVDGYQEDEYLLNKAAHELCKPKIDIHMELVHLGLRDIIVVTVKELEKKPVFVHAKGSETVYVRDKDKSVVASDEVVSVLQNEHSNRGVTFEYGPNEQKLFRYLNEYEKITVLKFSHLIDTSSYKASEILVNLVSAGILKLFTKNKTDYFCFSKDCR